MNHEVSYEDIQDIESEAESEDYAELEPYLDGHPATRIEGSTEGVTEVDAAHLIIPAGEAKVNLNAGVGIEQLITAWLRHHRVTYSVSTNSFRWLKRDYTQKELVDQIHLSLVFD